MVTTLESPGSKVMQRNPKTKSMYLPLIDMTPADPHTIKTAMKKAHQITTDCGQKLTVMTGDLELYKIAVNVLWAQPKEFDHFIVRLGGIYPAPTPSIGRSPGPMPMLTRSSENDRPIPN